MLELSLTGLLFRYKQAKESFIIKIRSIGETVKHNANIMLEAFKNNLADSSKG